MKLNKLFSDNILVTPYKEDTDSKIITPDSAEVEHSYYEINHVGQGVTEIEVGDIAIVNPQVVTRSTTLEIEGTEYLVLREDNVLGLAEDG